jgi:RNA-directed DNA polymerase
MCEEPLEGNTPSALELETVSTKQKRIAALARKHPGRALTSLNHHLDYAWMRVAYWRTRKDGAPGVDGQRATDYERDLEGNLRSLLDRIKSGRYQAPPVKRTYIPKEDGSRRALGIPTLEDKVAQRAVAMLLEPLYETVFADCSFGFRPGRGAHQALRTLRNHVMDEGVRWVLDVDLSKYFDTIDHGHLRSFLDQRVADGVVRRMIDKWLSSGVLEDESLHYSNYGTPQGGVISPLLANIYLHYVLDEWFEEAVRPRMKQRCSLVRYADDFVMMFEDYGDSQRVPRVLAKRMARFGLAVNEAKTRMVDFRFKKPQGRHWSCTTETFDFLGFTHVWGKSRRGKAVVRQITAKKRYARSCQAAWQWCKRHRHAPIAAQHRMLCRKLRGHYAYYGVTGNGKRLRWFHHYVERTWKHWLSRRSRKSNINWRRFQQLLVRYGLPPAKIHHSYQAASEPST